MTEALNMTRRRFVQACAMAGAAAAVGVSMKGTLVEADQAWAEAPVETKVYKTCCHGCIQVCPCLAYVRNGVVVKLEGDPDAPMSKGSLCVKGLNQLHTMYSPRRLLHPVKRAGERGENKWEQISWDEAIDLAAKGFSDCIDKYGNYSVMTSTGGGGAYLFFEAITLAWAFKSPNSFEPGCAQCYVPRNSMAVYMYGGANQSIADSSVTEPFNEWQPATEAIVLWGTQPSASQTAQAGRAMAELRSRGCKTVVIDPNFSPDASKADVWLPVRPGSDTALIMGFFRYIFENGLYDEEFVKYWTNLPFLVDPDTKMPVLAGELFPDYVSPTPENTPAYVCFDARTNGVQPFPFSAPADSPVDPEVFKTVEFGGKSYKTAGQIYREEAEPWTLEKVGETCWLDPEDIESAIRIYADAKVAGISNGVFSDQMNAASQVTIGCLGLDMVMGYVNKPGATLTQNKAPDKKRPTVKPMSPALAAAQYGNGATIGLTEAENRAAFDNETDKERQALFTRLIQDRLGMDKHRALYFCGMSTIPALHEAIDTGEPYRPRAWYDVSGNKLTALADAGKWYDSIGQFDFICGQYPMLTSFHIEACDVVFPTQEWLEYSGDDRLAQLNYNFMRLGVTHLGESVHPGVPPYKVLERVNEINPGSVLPDVYMGRHSEVESRNIQVQKFGAESWEDLVENQDKYVPNVTPDEKYWVYDQHLAVVDDGLPAGFATESRKCEVYASLLLKMSRTGYPHTFPYEVGPCEAGDYTPICTYVEPAEMPDDAYPLIMTSGRLPYFHHSTMRHAAFARELCPTAECRMNPQTAEQYGLVHMDWIKVTSRRGSVHARAYVTEGVAPGMLWMERFWNPECYDETQKAKTSGWREQNINVITTADGPFNEAYGSYTLRGFTVNIEKSERPEGVWVEPREFAPFLPTLQGEPVTENIFMEVEAGMKAEEVKING